MTSLNTAYHILRPEMKIISILIISLVMLSCDGGLAPTSQSLLGFSGKIYATPGSWPPSDSLVSLWVFASQIYPVDSAKVYDGLFSLSPKIFLYPSMNGSLPFYFDSITYSFSVQSGTYKYIGVIQQVNSDLPTYGIRALRVVGFYKDSLNPLMPGSIVVNNDVQVKEINIQVDFNNPPPPPF
jgi:hypothetical protein